MLINAAKKHQTEITKSLKYNFVIRNEINSKKPKMDALGILEIKGGIMIDNKYKPFIIKLFLKGKSKL